MKIRLEILQLQRFVASKKPPEGGW